MNEYCFIGFVVLCAHLVGWKKTRSCAVFKVDLEGENLSRTFNWQLTANLTIESDFVFDTRAKQS